MSKTDSQENSFQEAHGFSAFGGHLLAAMPALSATKAGAAGMAASAAGAAPAPAMLSALADLGIEDAEQVIAIAATSARAELLKVLHLDEPAFQTFLQQIQSRLPAATVAQFAEAAPQSHGLGVRQPSPEMMAEAQARQQAAPESASPVALPASVNLIPYFQPIRNQGPRGTCVSFTLTALNEYIVRRRGLARDLSEQHLYYETKLIDGSSGGCGTWQVKAVTVLSSRGQCRETVWPYLSALPCNNHGALPAAARPDGLNYKLATLAVPVHSVATYKAHMALQRPVTVSIPVYNSWYQSAATRTTGRITMRIGNEASIGGHAVCLVGYVDTASSPGGGYFIVRNSWGTSGFGSACPLGAGYGTIPYQYITNDAWEAFTAVVPGINSAEDLDTDDDVKDDDDGGGDGGKGGGKGGSSSSVTIAVGRNVKITIKTT